MNMITLGTLGMPIKIVLQHLNDAEKIKLASTNTEVKNLCMLESKFLKKIKELKKFDFQVFNETITDEVVNTVFRVFPDLSKITVRLANVQGRFLDNLRKFQSLKKLKVYLTPEDTLPNRRGLNLEKVTIKAEFYNFRNKDVIYELLWQIRGTRRISIYNGQLDRRLIYLLSTRNIEILKIQNCMITNPIHITNVILEFLNLKYLNLTTNNQLIAPYACHVMSDIIANLVAHRNLNIEKLVFTADINPHVALSNLRFLKHFKSMTIYYTVQNNGVNLERLIYCAASMKNVDVTFI